MTWHDLRREPYRLFFPLGVVSGCLGVGHWLALGLRWIPTGSGFFHASVQLNAYMMGFILGFLMTALPRFASAPPSSTSELLAALALFAGQVLAAAGGWWVVAQSCQAGLLVFLAVFAGRRFAGRTVSVHPPTEFVWVPLALLLGLIGSALLGLGQGGFIPSRWLGLARPLAQQGFTLGIVVGVAGFMAPRLMGTAMPPAVMTPQQATAVRWRRIRWHLAAGAVFTGSFVLEGAGRVQSAYVLRALVLTGVLTWTTRWYRRPAAQETYVRLLRMSLWMIVLGVWSAALLPAYRVAMLHAVFIGGLSLMTFAVGTMVIFSHAGEGAALRRPMRVLRIVAADILIAAIARISADTQPNAYFTLLAIASGAWLAAAMTWLIVMWPRLLRISSPGTFERLHEAAKQRLARPV